MIVIAIHVALGFAFLHLSGQLPVLASQADLKVFDLLNPPPPPPPPPPIQREQARPKPKQAAAAPKNIQSKATPIVRPTPKVVIPVPPPIVTAPAPNTGVQATQGAAATPGPGTGAGGTGNGTGGGGAGSGSGGGGGGGVAVRPALVRGFTSRDYPPQVADRFPPGGQVFVRVRVEADGRPSKCDVMRSFGDPSVDQWTCSLVMTRAVFRAATDASGKPISAWFGYVQR